MAMENGQQQQRCQFSRLAFPVPFSALGFPGANAALPLWYFWLALPCKEAAKGMAGTTSHLNELRWSTAH
jgi:hypothetical protein